MENNLDCDLSSIGVVHCLVKNFELPQNFLDGFIAAWWKGLNKYKNNPSDLNAKVRAIALFMIYVIEKKLFDPRAKSELWAELFTTYAGSHSSVQDLLKILQKSGESTKNSEN